MPEDLLEKILPPSKWKREKTPVILVACGSFSPITYLHLRLFEMARDALHDKEIFQVVGGFLSPVSDGYSKVGLAPSEHRRAMCRLATEDSDWIAVDGWESTQPTYQTTVSVLRSLKMRLRAGGVSAHVMLLAGADLIQSFEVPGLWDPDDLEEILGEYGCVIIDRWSSDISEFLLTDPILYRHRKNIHVVKQFISNDISSTKIRLFIARNLSNKYLLPENVIQYIEKHRLYR